MNNKLIKIKKTLVNPSINKDGELVHDLLINFYFKPETPIEYINLPFKIVKNEINNI